MARQKLFKVSFVRHSKGDKGEDWKEEGVETHVAARNFSDVVDHYDGKTMILLKSIELVETNLTTVSDWEE